MPPDLAPAIASFRRFNRSYTRFLGTLSDHYLQTEFSLAEGRVLYELASHPGAQAKEVIAALGLDAGYLSRILAKFTRARLVKRSTFRNDRRASNLHLTARGRGAVRTLNTRADRQATEVLGKLTADQRITFSDALGTVEQVIGARFEALAPEITLRPHCVGDLGMVVHLEGKGYAEQFGWDLTFEALVARIVADFVANFDARRERCWVAELAGRHMGHIFLMRHPDQPDTARLRLLYVDPAARGLGLGRRLVDECLRFARKTGYAKVTLWTQSILTSAHRIYQEAGFKLVKEEPHRSFGHELVGQTWELGLR